MCEIKTKIGNYDEANKWKEELTEDQQENVAKTESNHFWAGVTVGSIITAGLALLFRK
jgi:hypothetical protein